MNAREMKIDSAPRGGATAGRLRAVLGGLFAARALTAATTVLAVVAGGATAVKAGADETFFSRLSIAPSYESSYRVQRKAATWRQDFDVQRQSGLADLKGALRIESKEDEARNDHREWRNRFRFDADRQSALGTFKLYGSLQRNSRENINSLTVRNEDTIQLSHALALLDHDDRKLNLQLGGGWVGDRDLQESRRGGRFSQSDAQASGWIGEASLSGNWHATQALEFSSSVSWEGSVKESEAFLADTETDTTIAATDRARALALRSEAEWSAHPGLSVAVSGSYMTSSAQYFQRSVERQDTKRSNRHDFSLVVGGEPDSILSYEAEVYTSRTDYDYALLSSDKLSGREGLRAVAAYEIPRTLLAGTTVTANFDLGTRSEARENSAAYDTREHRLEGEISRPLGERMTLRARLATELIQDYYEDGGLDKDRVRDGASFVLLYRPSKRFQARGGYATKYEETINIREQRAGQNQTQEDFRVTADYQVLLPARVTVQQNFQISATYTYYIYDETKNSLTRTNRVTTKISAPLWQTTDLHFEHLYNKSDSGAYTYSGSGERAYSISSESIRQYLKAELGYRLTSELRIGASETFEVNQRDYAGRPSSSREKNTFTGEISYQREFMNGIMVNARFARTASNQEEDFWNINATVSKVFD